MGWAGLSIIRPLSAKEKDEPPGILGAMRKGKASLGFNTLLTGEAPFQIERSFFFNELSLHGPQACIESAFMPCRLIFRDQALARHAVNGGNRGLISRLGLGLVASGDGGDYFFNGSAHHGTK